MASPWECASRSQAWRDEGTGGYEVLDFLNRSTKSNDGEFDPALGQGVFLNVHLERLEPLVECVDWRAAHRAGRIQQEYACTARIWVRGEFGIECHLLFSFSKYT